VQRICAASSRKRDKLTMCWYVDPFFICSDMDPVLPQYFGPSNEVVSYFGRLGVKCPSNINAGEFCLNTVSVDHESKDTDEVRMKLMP
jgi:hypothetical protein